MGERTKEEWGRVAVGLPGFRWMPGMRWLVARPDPLEDLAGRLDDTTAAGLRSRQPHPGATPDPDDPATAGCLLAMLGGVVDVDVGGDRYVKPWVVAIIVSDDISGDGRIHTIRESNLGRACVAAVEAIGRWPGDGTC